MDAKAFLWKLSVGTPMVMSLVITIDHQVLNDDFNPIIVDQNLERRIESYVPHVRAVNEKLLAKKFDAKTVKNAVDLWVADVESKKLLPVLPCYYGESMEDGPKIEILTTAIRLGSLGMRLAIEQVQAGDMNEGLDSFEKSMTILETIRYSDLDTYTLCASKQARSFLFFATFKSRMTPVQEDRFLRLTRQFSLDRQKIMGIVHHSKRLYLQFSERYKGMDAELCPQKEVLGFVAALDDQVKDPHGKISRAFFRKRRDWGSSPEFLTKTFIFLKRAERTSSVFDSGLASNSREIATNSVEHYLEGLDSLPLQESGSL